MKNCFWAVFQREIERIKQRAKMLIFVVLIPMTCCFIICQLFQNAVPRDLPIALYNADNSSLSRTFERMLQSAPTLNIAYRANSLEEGRDLIVRGKAYAFVVIPRDFQRDIYKQKQPELISYYNNQLLLIGGMVDKDITTVARTLLAGTNIVSKTKRGTAKDVALSQVNIIKVDEHIRSNPYLNYSYFLGIAAIAHIFQTLIIFLSIWAIGVEFKEGTTKQWLKTADNSIITAVTGKFLAYFFLFLILILLVYLMYFSLSKIPLEGNMLLIMLSTVLHVIAYQMLGVLLMSWGGNLRFALSCAAFYTAFAFSFAGITFPQIGMPLFAKIYSNLLPVTHYMKIMVDQTIRDIPAKYDIASVFYIIALGLVGAAFLPLLKKLALSEKHWYKR